MKAYTDLEQSKKLAEILPLESADMTWCFDDIKEEPFIFPYHLNIEDSKDVLAWSLAALLEEMNRNDYKIFLHNNADLTWTISFNDSERYIDIDGDDPVDICFEMIIKLNEQKLL